METRTCHFLVHHGLVYHGGIVIEPQLVTIRQIRYFLGKMWVSSLDLPVEPDKIVAFLGNFPRFLPRSGIHVNQIQ